MSDATMWKGTTGSCPYNSCPKCSRACFSPCASFAHSCSCSRALHARAGSRSSRRSAGARAGARAVASRRWGTRAAARRGTRTFLQQLQYTVQSGGSGCSSASHIGTWARPQRISKVTASKCDSGGFSRSNSSSAESQQQAECVVIYRFAPEHVGHAALVSSEQQLDVHSLGGGAVCRASGDVAI
eukprot:1773580-Prymnesium_polylepis.1